MSSGPTSNNETGTKSKTGDVAETPFAMSMTMVAFLGIAFFNALELIFLVTVTFKRYSGLYFWSVLIAASGIPVYCLGFTLKFFVTNVPHMNYIGLAIVILGWVPMVTGQSLALYSRLNLVVHDRRKLRWVLWMIIFNAFAFHGTTTGLSFAAESSEKLAAIYSAYEKAELTAFTVQECIISSLYISATHRILRPTTAAQGQRITAVRRNLICVNVIVILLDVSLIAIEFANQYKIQTTFKALVYSVKLGLEFSVLNTLLRAIQGRSSSSYGSGSTPIPPNSSRHNHHRHRRSSLHNPIDAFRGACKTTFGSSHIENVGTFSKVSKGDNGDGATAAAWEVEMGDVNILKTTEIYVASSCAPGDAPDDRRHDDHDADADSVNSKAHRATSRSSSEVNLAENGVYQPRD